jgi:hypothetical protein
MYLVLVTFQDWTQDVVIVHRANARKAKSFARMQYPHMGIRSVKVVR